MVIEFDVIVVGGGHAGCEAATASANMGARTCLVTMDMNKIAQMSCNPAVGGIAKGQIVREIDAMGGQMGLVTDSTAIQFRMLNVGKGPAVWSPRAQCDREKFIWKWRNVLDSTPNLSIWQDQAERLLVEGDHVAGVETIWGAQLRGKCVIITAGTFLNGLMHIGRKKISGGRIAEPAVAHLSESITRHGIRSGRMKTGTPVRIDKRSVDFSLLEVQDGDSGWHQFSFMPRQRSLKQLPCWTLNTNEEVHEELRKGLADSPLFNGQIQSIGPRYCPSIETKLVTFADRDQHPLFLEPEGEETNEMYLNGFSSSLPMEVQVEALRKIPALRDVQIYRPGYAIEYDYFDPTQLWHSLESKIIKGLFFAGQVNGTTGYEEAGGQGLVAGINAAILSGRTGFFDSDSSGAKPFVLGRNESYIGVLIDDLVTKGVDEPYRMFTSRAEYRILLRQDCADARLTEKAYKLGLAREDRWKWYIEKKEGVERLKKACQDIKIKPKEINDHLSRLGSTPIQYGTRVASLLARPELNINNLSEGVEELRQAIEALGERKDEIVEATEIGIKYEGYIEREEIEVAKMHRLENIKLRSHFNYADLKQLSTEARQKLKTIDPENLAQASRIPGVSPSDINVLLILSGR